ncbi:E3 ubiquitin-protein ligase RNF144 [Microdochium nivale]|nr:E3 ubiquitin-protein ligase RNF144 [Microdochium nivale]
MSATHDTLAHVDDDSAALILQLLEDDAHHASNALASNGGQADGVESDAQMAMRLFLRDEVDTATMFINNRRTARNIETAAGRDREAYIPEHDDDDDDDYDHDNAFVLAQRQELMAVSDRELALTLARESDGPDCDCVECVRAGGSAAHNNNDSGDGEYMIDDPNRVGMAPAWDDEIPSPHFPGHTSDAADLSEDENNHLAPGAATQQIPRQQGPTINNVAVEDPDTLQCNACLDDKTAAELVTAPCNHAYCSPCLEHMFRAALADESLFPPRCCQQPIPTDGAAAAALPVQLLRDIGLKRIEVGTAHRVYCSDPACATFIPAAGHVAGIATCPACRRRTCAACKREAHEGSACPVDPEDQGVLELARRER